MQPIPTQLTVHTNVPHGLHTSSITDLPILHILTDFHNYACTFMSWRANIEFTHSWHGEVFEHVVEIGVANPSCVEAEENLIWPCASEICE
jgi:hypothetical protein